MTTICPVCKRRVAQPATGRPRLYDRRSCRDLAWRTGAARAVIDGKARTVRDAIRTTMQRASAR